MILQPPPSWLDNLFLKKNTVADDCLNSLRSDSVHMDVRSSTKTWEAYQWSHPTENCLSLP